MLILKLGDIFELSFLKREDRILILAYMIMDIIYISLEYFNTFL